MRQTSETLQTQPVILIGIKHNKAVVCAWFLVLRVSAYILPCVLPSPLTWMSLMYVCPSCYMLVKPRLNFDHLVVLIPHKQFLWCGPNPTQAVNGDGRSLWLSWHSVLHVMVLVSRHWACSTYYHQSRLSAGAVLGRTLYSLPHSPVSFLYYSTLSCHLWRRPVRLVAGWRR